MVGRLLRLREVCQSVGLGKSSVWLKVQRGEFPAPVRFGGRATRWVEGEIEDWKRTLIAGRDGPAPKPRLRQRGGGHEPATA